MKTTLLTLIAAFALSAAPSIITRSDVKAFAFQADAGTCQSEVSRGNPCVEHITVFLLPHNASGVYRVTISFHSITGNQESRTLSKLVPALDSTPTATFLLSSVVLDTVTVETAQ